MGGGIALSACSNGNSDNENTGNDGNESDVKKEIVARMTTVNSELTFYENGTVEFKEDDAAKSVLARAITANAVSSQGTYEGNVTEDNAEISLNFTSGKMKGRCTAKIAERDDASNISMTIDGKNRKLEKIQTLVTAWRAASGKTVYFYDDNRAMQVIKASGKTTCHPLVYTGNAGKDGEVQLALLDGAGSQAKAQARSQDALLYEPATISGSTMSYDGDTYTNINNDRTLVTAWRATTKEDGKSFLETMYFYDDGMFMIVMNKKVNGQITNGFAGTYEGDTTKDDTVNATIEGFHPLSGTIASNKLTIAKSDEITYDRIN